MSKFELTPEQLHQFRIEEEFATLAEAAQENAMDDDAIIVDMEQNIVKSALALSFAAFELFDTYPDTGYAYIRKSEIERCLGPLQPEVVELIKYVMCEALDAHEVAQGIRNEADRKRRDFYVLADPEDC